MNHFDFLVIGGGSAGWNAARTARDLGKRVAIVDGAPELGGLCILRGCMPSKTLFYMTEVLHLAQQGKTFGLKIPKAAPDLKAMQARKRRLIADFAGYRQKAMQSDRYSLFRSQARFVAPNTIELDDGRQLTAAKILVATGSRVSVPPIPGLPETPFWTSDEILDLEVVPESIIVLGGGIVACELAQFLRRVGTKVIQIQRSARILRDFSEEASSVIEGVFRREGIELYTGTELKQIGKRGKGFEVTFKQGGKTIKRRAARLLNALGREPNVEGLNLAAAGVELDEAGRIRTNAFQQTSNPDIYAGGDVSGPVEVVHLAVAQGELAARHAFGIAAKPIKYEQVLTVAFTSPPVANLGPSSAQLKAAKVATLEASYPFNDHGKSMLMEANDGFVAVRAEAATGRLLGAEIVGPDAGELIHAFTGPVALGATAADLLAAPWYHPTLAEIVTYPLEEIVSAHR